MCTSSRYTRAAPQVRGESRAMSTSVLAARADNCYRPRQGRRAAVAQPLRPVSIIEEDVANGTGSPPQRRRPQAPSRPRPAECAARGRASRCDCSRRFGGSTLRAESARPEARRGAVTSPTRSDANNNQIDVLDEQYNEAVLKVAQLNHQIADAKASLATTQRHTNQLARRSPLARRRPLHQLAFGNALPAARREERAAGRVPHELRRSRGCARQHVALQSSHRDRAARLEAEVAHRSARQGRDRERAAVEHA